MTCTPVQPVLYGQQGRAIPDKLPTVLSSSIRQ